MAKKGMHNTIGLNREEIHVLSSVQFCHVVKRMDVVPLAAIEAKATEVVDREKFSEIIATLRGLRYPLLREGMASGDPAQKGLLVTPEGKDVLQNHIGEINFYPEARMPV